MVLVLVALLPASSFATPLDKRQRDVQTIVADALAQLPAATPKTLGQVMSELAATGAEGVETMAGMLVPADRGKNASVEYALSGVVNYVTAAGREKERAGVRKGLAAAIEACTDNANRAFLMAQLQYCSAAEDAPVFIKYLKDPYLSDFAVRGLVSTTGADEAILDLMKNEAAPRAVLAHAAYERRLAAAEPILLSWSDDADRATRSAVLDALSVCGGSASLKVLADAARAENYGWSGEGGATASYFRLLGRLASGDRSKEAVKAAKPLLKNERAYLRGAALDVVLTAEGRQGMPYVLAALKDKDIEVRNAALRSASAFADDAVYAAVVAKMPSLSAEARVDVINWLGARHAASQVGAVVAAVGSECEALALAGIRAAGRIGGEEALEALLAQLNGPRAAEASAALLAFNGKIDAGVRKALDADAATQIRALELASARRMHDVSDRVFALLDSENAALKDAAYDALAGVVGPDDFDRLGDLLEQSQDSRTAKVQTALKRAVEAQAPEKQYEAASARMARSAKPALYYPVLAQAGTADAIALLRKGVGGADRDAAFDALLKVDNPAMIDVLYAMSCKDASLADRALSRYTALVAASGETPVRKYQLYRRALELNPSEKVENQTIRALASVHVFPAFVLAAKYLDDPATAAAAAAAVKTIAAKNGEQLGGEAFVKALEKAQAVYKTLPGADAGYAVDEITELLAKVPAAGYVPVFDGTLEAWTAVTGDPATRAALKPKQLAKEQAAADAAAAANWTADASGVKYAGAAPSTIGTKRDYENFEMYFDWKSEGPAGVAVRSIPQIALGAEGGSGALTGNKIHASKPLADADNGAGAWNTMYVRVVDDRVTVVLNGRTVIRNTILENACSPADPAYVRGRIELIGEGAPVEFRDLYIRELPSTPVCELSAEEAAEGFEMLFDGRSLHKWTGNTTDYLPENGTLYVSAQYGGIGNLYTVKEYGDFVLRFEFCFEREGVNNGIGIRTPMGVDAAYYGMEIQILDHDAPIYKNLRVYQQHGSVYGIIPAERVKFGPLGTWNVEEIRAVGDRITVTVNGKVILDGDIREACQGHNVSEDGSRTNPYTVDRKNHPGLFNKRGHIGFLGHGVGIRFRNVRVLDLEAQVAGRPKSMKK